jgi:hypothetical protein
MSILPEKERKELLEQLQESLELGKAEEASAATVVKLVNRLMDDDILPPETLSIGQELVTLWAKIREQHRELGRVL